MLLKKLIDNGCLHNLTPELIAELASMGYVNVTPPPEEIVKLVDLLSVPLRDSEFAASTRQLLKPVLTHATHSSLLAAQVGLWSQSLISDHELIAAYRTYREAIA